MWAVEGANAVQHFVVVAVAEPPSREQDTVGHLGRPLACVLSEDHDNGLVLGGDCGLDVAGSTGPLAFGGGLEEFDAQERDAMPGIHGGLPDEVGLGFFWAAVAGEETDDLVVHGGQQRAVGKVPEPQHVLVGAVGIEAGGILHQLPNRAAVLRTRGAEFGRSPGPGPVLWGRVARGNLTPGLPQSEVGRRRGARGSGPLPNAPSRTVRASFPAYRSPVIISGWWLCPVPRGCPDDSVRRPPGSCACAWPSGVPTLAVPDVPAY